MTRKNIKELASQRFIAVPKLLLYGEEYRKLSSNAFKTYVTLYDRYTLSVMNNWTDEDGNIYFVYDLEELSQITGIGKKGLVNARNQLKEAGLLEEVYTGRNNRLYLHDPKPQNDEEARYIITEKNDLEDTSKISAEEKALRSINAKNKQNVKNSDDSAQGTIVQKRPPYQQYSNNEKQTIVPKALSDSAQGTPNDTKLVKLSKDIKDIKHQTDFQNEQMAKQFSKNEKDTEQDLIEQYIDENELISAYGLETIKLVKSYSFSDLEQFKVYIDKFYFGWKSAEKDTSIKINPYEKAALHDELAKTFKRVVIQFKQGKTKNINNYLYVSLKNVFIDFSTSQLSNTDLPPVPLDKWLG